MASAAAAKRRPYLVVSVLVTALICVGLGYRLGTWHDEMMLNDQGLAALKESRLRDAEHYYVALDSLGDREADFWLGQINIEGDGVPVDHNKALYWFARSPEPKPDLYLRLGDASESGNALPRNLREAAFWYHQAVLLGSKEGQRRLDALSRDQRSTSHR